MPIAWGGLYGWIVIFWYCSLFVDFVPLQINRQAICELHMACRWTRLFAAENLCGCLQLGHFALDCIGRA